MELRRYIPSTIFIVILGFSPWGLCGVDDQLSNDYRTQICTHWVEPNENLENIAQRYQVDLNQLSSINHLNNDSTLFAGQVLKIPSDNPECENNFNKIELKAIKQLDKNVTKTLEKISTSKPNETKPKTKINSTPQTAPHQEVITSVKKILEDHKHKDQTAQLKIENYLTSNQQNDAKKINSELNTIIQKNNDQQNRDDKPNHKNYICSAKGSQNLTTPKNMIDDFMFEKKMQVANFETKFGKTPYAYYANSETLMNLLKNFAASYGVPIKFSETIQKELNLPINGKLGPFQAKDFLNHIASIYGLIWYYDGHMLYIYDSSAAVQEIINLNFLSADQLKYTLEQAGLWDKRFLWKAQPKQGVIFLSGPPRYLAIIKEVVALLDEKEEKKQKSKLIVCSFKLKYTWATDQSFNFRGKKITVPGIVSILREIIQGGGVAKVPDAPSQDSTKPQSITPVKSLTNHDKNDINTQSNSTNFTPLNAGISKDDVIINADPRQNSVLVHDLENKMPMYASLIESLDKPTSQIEISVSIIDISTEVLESLGLEYKFSDGTTDIKFDPNRSGQIFPAFTTIISSNLNKLNVKINMLANEGKARVLSRPSVLTLDNLEAVLNNSSTSYVKVEANQDAQLFPIVAGTVIQVTPRIIEEKAGRKIHMTINIEDGKGTSADSQTLPVVNNSSLNTQAIVHEQESILIGGFYTEQKETAVTKIPFLGDIPVLGRLFQTKRFLNNKKVRIFLITPRIIDMKINN